MFIFVTIITYVPALIFMLLVQHPQTIFCESRFQQGILIADPSVCLTDFECGPSSYCKRGDFASGFLRGGECKSRIHIRHEHAKEAFFNRSAVRHRGDVHFRFAFLLQDLFLVHLAGTEECFHFLRSDPLQSRCLVVRDDGLPYRRRSGM